jgi:hypothetical protein
MTLAIVPLTWPTTYYEFLPKDSSDYSAMVVQFDCPISKVKTTFKFLNLWVDRDDLLGLVVDTWQILVIITLCIGLSRG